jgi:hypothetical protein
MFTDSGPIFSTQERKIIAYAGIGDKDNRPRFTLKNLTAGSRELRMRILADYD